MTRPANSLPAEYFADLYAADPDPWRFADSAYERAKYAATLAALPRARYAKALEVGCSIGVLTHALASRCDALLAIDAAAAPLLAARSRCVGQPHAAFERRRVPEEWPDGLFDLILLSEVVYYLVPDDVTRLANRVGEAVAPGADILLVHWTDATDYPLSGDSAAEHFIAAAVPFARITRQERAAQYRLDLLQAH